MFPKPKVSQGFKGMWELHGQDTRLRNRHISLRVSYLRMYSRTRLLHAVSPLAVTAANAPSVLLVLSSSITDADAAFTIPEPSASASSSVSLSSADLLKYVRSTSVTIKEHAFAEQGAAGQGVTPPGTHGPVPVASAKSPGSSTASHTAAAKNPASAEKGPAPLEHDPANIQSLGVTIKKDNDDFGGWYRQVLTYGDMLDYYDVSGCYILKPASYVVWEFIQRE